jgi:hypothetical protein
MVSQRFDVVLVGRFTKDKDVVDGEEKNLLGGSGGGTQSLGELEKIPLMILKG